MSNDGKLVFIYAVIVAAMTLLYVGYEDIGLMNHARASRRRRKLTPTTNRI